MKKFIYNRILIWAMAVGLIAALVICGQRHAVEVHNNQIDMVMDYDSIVSLAAQEGLDFFEVLHKMKAAGITSIAVYDSTFEKLNRLGKVRALSGSEIVGNYQRGILFDDAWRYAVAANIIDANKIYIVGRDLQTYEDVKVELTRRLGKDRVKPITLGGMEIIEVKDRYETFLKMPVVMLREELDIVKDAGLMILARPTNFEKCTPDDVHAVFERLSDYPVSEIVFNGDEVLGAFNYVDATAEEMKKRDITFGVIEHFSQLQFYPQAGMNQLVRELGYDNVARLYAIPRDEQPKLLIETAVNRWVTTDHERNIRINLFRTYEKRASGMTLLETNLKYISETTQRLKDAGYTFGKAGTFENYYPNRILRALVIIGAMAAVVLYLSLISRRLNGDERLQLMIFGAAAICAVIPILMGAGGKVRLIAALIGANFFPALAVIWQLDRLSFLRLKSRWQSIRSKSDGGSEYPKVQVRPELTIAQVIWLAVASLFVTSVISMTGAAYLSGALSDVNYFLEFEIFRGIKLTFILPLILVAIAFLQRFNIIDEVRKNIPAWEQVKEILEMNITVKSALIGLIILAALVVFIARSGHTAGMPVSGAEIKVRAWLESLFYARPRSKEIFIGHPAFVLMIAAFLKKFPKMICFALTIVATIGQSSMVETFAHMRTPIFMSVMRGIDGVIPGACIGAILILVIYFVTRFSKGVKQAA